MEILTKKELWWEGWDVNAGYSLQIRNNKFGRVSGWPKVSQEGIAYPSEREEQFVLRESQSHSCRQEEQTTRTVTLWPGALGKQTAWSGWRPMCFSCFSPPVLWYQKKTQSEEDGVLPGSSMGDPIHDKVMQKRPDKQGRPGLKGPPGPAWGSTPKPESVLTLMGGYTRPTFSEGNQLRALVNKSPGHNRSVSIQTPQMSF